MKVAIYGQYYKVDDKIYIEELLHLLQKNNVEFVIENQFYSNFKNIIKLNNVYMNYYS